MAFSSDADLNWAVANKARYGGVAIVLMMVVFWSAVSLWLLPLSGLCLFELAALNQRRAKFIEAPRFIALAATALWGLVSLMWAALRFAFVFDVMPGRPWGNVFGISQVLIGGGAIVCHTILRWRYGSPFDEPGHPPKASAG